VEAEVEVARERNAAAYAMARCMSRCMSRCMAWYVAWCITQCSAAACAMAATHSAALPLSAAASSKVRSPLWTEKRQSLAEAFLASGVETMASARETSPRSEGRQRFSEGRR